MATLDADQFRAQSLYNLDDPQAALRNAMRDEGINPYAANPYAQWLLRSAQGLANAFIQYKATGQGPRAGVGEGATADQAAREAFDFGNFLRGSLRTGSNYANIRGAGAQLPDAVRRVREYQEALARGTPASQLNPYLALLSDRMAANSGQGLMNLYATYYAPQFNRTMGQSYLNMLDSAYSTGFYNYLQSQERDYRDDVYRYLLGF
jgi:hypothetical protein